MKTLKILLVILLAAISFEGCITSLYPLYTAKDLVFDKRLLGTWRSDSSAESWKLENLMDKELSVYKDPKEREKQEIIKGSFINKNTYLLTYTEKGEKVELLLNLVKLENNFYIDFYPGPLNGKNEMLKDYYLPVHSYAKIKIAENGFELWPLDQISIYNLVKENKIRIKHEDLDNFKVITASTEELQKFVIKFSDNKELFSESRKFKKSV
ncbi:hypothetical protein [Chitinophaga sp.]|uniref:hypothetical protein n=1 Tax=Chitinophaga sp. TaxID=1869181 RepID=UPI002F931BAB